MCGIIYAKNLRGQSVNDLVKIIYQNQKSRGQQGFGFVGLNTKQIDTYRATNEKGIMQYLNQSQYSEVMFHHRLPTSTENTLESTHPFIVEIAGKTYYFVHNGIIQNDDELKDDHVKRGIKYESQTGRKFNDSEALCWDFALWLNRQQDKMKAQGTATFVCLETDRKTSRAVKLYFYCNDRTPLRIYRDKSLLVLSSNGYYPLIKQNRLYYWDYKERQIRRDRTLIIECPISYSPNDYQYMVMELEQERDFHISVGNYTEADMLEEEIEDLRSQLRKGRSLTPLINGW